VKFREARIVHGNYFPNIREELKVMAIRRL
jgi:hypothetical protein